MNLSILTQNVVMLLEAAANLNGIGAAIVVGLTGLGAAIGMGMSISKSAESISRQPEASGNIRATLMIGLAFIETVALYGFVIAILLVVL